MLYFLFFICFFFHSIYNAETNEEISSINLESYDYNSLHSLFATKFSKKSLIKDDTTNNQDKIGIGNNINNNNINNMNNNIDKNNDNVILQNHESSNGSYYIILGVVFSAIGIALVIIISNKKCRQKFNIDTKAKGRAN